MAPLRILHILHSMNRGGAENALMNYYRQIDKSKIQFDFLLTNNGRNDFDEEILDLGGKIFTITPLTISNLLKYIRELRLFLRHHTEYIIVHSHTSSKSVVPLAIARSLNIPVRISHSHNSMSEKGINGLIRDTLMPFLKLTANVYFSCGRQAARWLYGEKMIRQGKINIIHNVINASLFRYDIIKRLQIRHTLGIDKEAFIIGNVARFCKEKNHLFSVEILREVITKHPDTILLLVGDGEERPSIESYAKKLGVFEKIKFVGVVPNVYDYEQAMDVFILPSLYEGLPLSIIEAQVSGLPCFTTKGTVSEECSVTDLVNYLPLESGASFWADEILKVIGKERNDRFNEVKAAGYDSVSAAVELQELYINLASSAKMQ